MTAIAFASRPHGWTTLHELTCPNGHHIPQNAVLLEHGAIRCKHKTQGRPHDAGVECGAWLYVMGSVGWTVVVDPATSCETIELGEDVYVAAVTYAELKQIRAKRLGASATLSFLGLPRASMQRRC